MKTPERWVPTVDPILTPGLQMSGRLYFIFSLFFPAWEFMSFGFELRMEPTNGTEGKKQRRGWGQTGGFYSMTSSDMKLLAPKIQQEK